MKNLTLVDADSIYFRAAYKLKKNEVRKKINEIMKLIDAQSFGELRVAVKGKDNWRKQYFPDYKANRNYNHSDELREALNYGHQYMCDKWGAVRSDGMEADDLVAIWAHEARDMGVGYVVAGIDKDLLQIPGAHYNFIKETYKDISIYDADFNLHIQCLTGDTSDNIPGIKGIGPVKAERILRDIPSHRMWNRVRAAWRYANAGNPDITRRLVTMIKSWEEFDGIQAECEAILSKPNVLQKQKEDRSLHAVPGRHQTRTPRDRVETW